MNFKKKRIVLIAASLLMLSIGLLLHFEVFSLGSDFYSFLVILTVVALVLVINGLTRVYEPKDDEIN
ncbi:MAG: urea transporter [Arenicella sp.]|jgi:urea transporter